MKKMKWRGGLCAVALAMLASVAMIGCELELGDKADRAACADSSFYVALGGENTFNISSVKIDGVEKAISHSTLAPSSWNAISEFETVEIYKGSSVSFTFTQQTQGANSWNSWALALYDNATVSTAKGQFIRGDNWLNKSADAGFSAGLWVAGASSANGSWSNGYTYETCAGKLPTDATVVVTVSYDGTNATIKETVNGDTAYETDSSKW